MAQEIPISKVAPTHSTTKLVKFTNIDDEVFVHSLGGKRYSFRPGVSIMLSENLAFHFARNLAHKIIFRDDDSLKKYAGIDEKLNRNKTARGETPLIKGVSQEAIKELVKVILNNHKLEPVEVSDGPVDASEIGMEVKDKKEDSPVKTKKAKKETKESEFEDLE